MRTRLAERQTSTLILVHGSWHTGRCWSAVQAHLATANVESVAPTLPGHSGERREHVSHADYVETVLEILDSRAAPAVLVGHSFGGSVISRVAELRPERCRGLIYYSAFVPRDGECVADSLPPQLIEFLDQAASSSNDGTVALPDELLREAFANTADETTLAQIRAQLVPEPHAPIFEALELPNYAELEIPCAYITCRDDRSLPPGTFHPGQSSRLRDPELIEIEGDHEALLTAPERLVDALLEALYAIDAAQRPRHPARHFVYKLIPPRPSFDQDATSREQEIMSAHVAYWQELADAGKVLIFGPVRDSHGASGIAIVEAESHADVRKIGERDPAVTSDLCTYDIGIMPVSITGTTR